MDKRQISKYFAKLVVGTTVGSAVTRVLINKAPKTERFKIAEVTGGMVGYYAQEQLEPYTDSLVDEIWDRLESKKTHN